MRRLSDLRFLFEYVANNWEILCAFSYWQSIIDDSHPGVTSSCTQLGNCNDHMLCEYMSERSFIEEPDFPRPETLLPNFETCIIKTTFPPRPSTPFHPSSALQFSSGIQPPPTRNSRDIPSSLHTFECR